MTKRDPFKYFHSSPEIIRLAVMMYVRFPLSPWNVEDLLHERGVEVSHKPLSPAENGRGVPNKFYGILVAYGVEKVRRRAHSLRLRLGTRIEFVLRPR